MREPTYSNDTMNMTGPVCDGSTADYLMYCDALCAEQADCVEDAVFEAFAKPSEVCAFCGKPLLAAEDIPLFDETGEPIAPPPPPKEYDGPPIWRD